MAQGVADPIECPRFKFISESYISNASSPELCLYHLGSLYLVVTPPFFHHVTEIYDK